MYNFWCVCLVPPLCLAPLCFSEWKSWRLVWHGRGMGKAWERDEGGSRRRRSKRQGSSDEYNPGSLQAPQHPGTQYGDALDAVGAASQSVSQSSQVSQRAGRVSLGGHWCDKEKALVGSSQGGSGRGEWPAHFLQLAGAGAGFSNHGNGGSQDSTKEPTCSQSHIASIPASSNLDPPIWQEACLHCPR